MPVDGLVTDGQTLWMSHDDWRKIPIEKKVGDTITSATINQNGSIDYQAIRVQMTASSRLLGGGRSWGLGTDCGLS